MYRYYYTVTTSTCSSKDFKMRNRSEAFQLLLNTGTIMDFVGVSRSTVVRGAFSSACVGSSAATSEKPHQRTGSNKLGQRTPEGMHRGRDTR